MKGIKTAYYIPWPELPDTPVNFSMGATIAGNRYTFNFKWFDEHWSVFVTFPDQSVREAALYPQEVAWYGYPDYGLVVNTALSAIGQTQLADCALYFVEWQ